MRFQILWVYFSLFAFALHAESLKIDLSGQWMFRLDSLNKGLEAHWENSSFTALITLPGALQNQGYGNDITAETPWVAGQSRSSAWFIHPMYEAFRTGENICYPNNFQPKKHYVGPAWYKKTVYIPEGLDKRSFILTLERVHWLSTLWIDDQLVGSCQSLLAPHRYDISQFVRPGKTHTITLRIDNSQVVDVGINAHSWGDQTMTAWNGVVGEMSLCVQEPISLADMQIYTDVEKKRAVLRFKLENLTGQTARVKLTSVLKSYNTPVRHVLHPEPFTYSVAPGVHAFSHAIDLTEEALLWDEYTPNLYRMETVLQADAVRQSYVHSFGVRELSAKENRFYLNGKEIYLRGNVICGTFPQTGYASMDYSDWKRIMTIHKYYGLNHVRFHSWTPPRAAFQAADEVGMYLFTETDVWASIKTPEQETFLQQEGRMLLQEYGNHPSFLFMGMGNELSADKGITNRLLSEWKKEDNRRLYAGLANSMGSITDEFDFVVTREVRSNIGWPPRPECSYFYRNTPSTDFVFDNPVKYPVPLITHEAGQHCSYPALDQMLKFTGTQSAGYIEIARSQLEERGMLHQWPDFVRASGKLQSLFYKHELETYLRMPRHTGYQILQLEDFPGQGSALVGVLDYFYDSKGYITPQEFRQFCAPQVLLAKLSKFVWGTDEQFQAEMLYANWSREDLRNTSVQYRIADEEGTVLVQKTIATNRIDRGDAVSLGHLQLDLSGIRKACKLTLSACVLDSDIQNQWTFWVYPSHDASDEERCSLPVTTVWNDSVASEVSAGKTVVLQLNKKQIRGDLPPAFLPIYWTQFDKMGNSQTMGILCNPRHPLFRQFPTDAHTDWQWFELLNDATPLIFDAFGMESPWSKSFTPLIQLVDGWKTNRKLGVLAEATFGKGRVIVTSMNLTDDLESRLAARQFRRSLSAYIRSEAFAPAHSVSQQQLEALLRRTPEVKPSEMIRSIRLENMTSGSKQSDLFDTDQSTVWQGQVRNEKKASAMILELKKQEGVGGVIYTPSDKKQVRNIPYQLYLSQDGKEWGIPIVRGNIGNGASHEIDLLYFHQARYLKLEFAPVSEMKQIAIAELTVMVE